MREKGFTLVELLMTVTVLVILTTVAVPSFTGLYDRHRLKGALSTLYADMQFARSEAVRRNQAVFFSFRTGTDWCYGLDSASSCNCGTAGDCDIKAIDADHFPGTELTGAAFGAGTSAHFKPRNGSVSAPGTALFLSSGGKQACAIVSMVGRVRLCSPDGANHLAGYPTCPCS